MADLTDRRLEQIFRGCCTRAKFTGAHRRFGYAVAAEVGAPAPELVAAGRQAREALRHLVSALGAARYIMRDADARAEASHWCRAGQAAVEALAVTLPPAIAVPEPATEPERIP
jgi:hypothetical protein